MRTLNLGLLSLRAYIRTKNISARTATHTKMSKVVYSQMNISKEHSKHIPTNKKPPLPIYTATAFCLRPHTTCFWQYQQVTMKNAGNAKKLFITSEALIKKLLWCARGWKKRDLNSGCQPLFHSSVVRNVCRRPRVTYRAWQSNIKCSCREVFSSSLTMWGCAPQGCSELFTRAHAWLDSNICPVRGSSIYFKLFS